MDESPIAVSPTLATIFGINHAIILQQIHWWNVINKKKNNNFHEGRFWCFNSYREWSEKDFPWLSEHGIRKIIVKLTELKLLLVGNFNKRKYDQTRWYCINYKELDHVIQKVSDTKGQDNCPKRTDHVIQKVKCDLTQSGRPIPNKEINKNNNKEIKKLSKNELLLSEFKEEFNKSNLKRKGRDYRFTTRDDKHLKQLIKESKNITEFKKLLIYFDQLCDSYSGYKFRPLTMINNLDELYPENEKFNKNVAGVKKKVIALTDDEIHEAYLKAKSW